MNILERISQLKSQLWSCNQRNKQLRNLVKEAFREGCEDGYWRIATNDAWEHSVSKQALKER